MNDRKNYKQTRWLYLIVGTIAMLFAGIIYAWSILKTPFVSQFNWSATSLALNFTLTMSFFCIGGLLGANLAKRIGTTPTIIISGLIVAVGFILTSRLSGDSVFLLYVTYGGLAGTGIGISYNVVIGTVNAWFPDKKGVCSGCLMMGFGASALLLGTAASNMFDSSIGWRNTYIILGIVLGIVLSVAAIILKRPGADVVLPAVNNKSNKNENFEQRDYTSAEMLRRPSFWMIFICTIFLAAVGSSVISFARDLAISVHASTALATTLVGVLSICNGLGRILTGISFDVFGRRKTMLAANCLVIIAASTILLAVLVESVAICIIGLCLTGLSYGSCPTTTAAFVSNFYGMKHFPSNMAIMTFNLMGGSLIATLSSTLLANSGGYVVPFIMLLSLSLIALILNLLVRRP